MRKVLWSVFAILAVASCLAGASWAQQTVFGYEGDAAHFETITCGATAGTPSSSYVSATVRPRAALLTVYSQNVIVSFHGTAASATVGHQWVANAQYEVRGYMNVKNISCINAVSGTTGYLRATYFY